MRFIFPITPKLSATYDDTMRRALDRWIRGVRDWTNHQPRWIVLEMAFRAGTTPSKAVDLTVAPSGVIVIAFDDVTTGKSAQPSQPLKWTFGKNTQNEAFLTFDSFAGIAGTDDYRLRVLVMEAV